MDYDQIKCVVCTATAITIIMGVPLCSKHGCPEFENQPHTLEEYFNSSRAFRMDTIVHSASASTFSTFLG